MRSSWDAHSSSRGTHGLEGAWGATLEAEWDQSGRSLPYIGMEALGSKSLNWSTTRSPTAQEVLRHKESDGVLNPSSPQVNQPQLFHVP